MGRHRELHGYRERLNRTADRILEQRCGLIDETQ